MKRVLGVFTVAALAFIFTFSAYSQMWAGLMLADLTGMHPRILARHMGKEGAARFLEYHRQQG